MNGQFKKKTLRNNMISLIKFISKILLLINDKNEHMIPKKSLLKFFKFRKICFSVKFDLKKYKFNF